MAKAPTSDELRNAIDRGRTADKVGFPDPALAPLGTDAEAGGAPPTQEELSRAAARIGSVRSELDARHASGMLVYVVLAVPVCLILLVVVALTAIAH